VVRKRILHVAKRFWPFVGGQERYVMDLAAAQVRRGHRCLVVTPERDMVDGRPGLEPRRDRIEGVEILRLPVVGGSAKQFIAGLPLDLLRAIRWADVVHHHDPRFAFETTLAAAAFLGRPVIVHTHGLFFHTTRSARLKRVAMRRYYGPLLGRLTAAVIPGSREDELRLAELAGLSAERVVSIPTGIDLRRAAISAHQPERGRIFMVGRLAAHKGHAAALEALALVQAPWRLAVAGRGSDAESQPLRARAVALGIAHRVEWLGEVDDAEVQDRISRARLLLFPSRFEGFGLALVEALAGGAIVLASRIPAHEAILAGTPLQDRLVDFEDAGGAAARISEELARSSRYLPALRAAAIERAADFSIERVADEVDELYERLLPESGTTRGAASTW
jgi:alpha-1,3-mannosyltransferase